MESRHHIMIRANLILLRHGQSQTNQSQTFTGWLDAPLSDLGRAQAARAGRLLAQAGPPVRAAFCSRLSRAAQTLELALAAMGRPDLPRQSLWRLNERHVGQLQGLAKDEALARFGPELIHAWRHGLDLAPPPLSPEDPRHPRHDPLHADVDPALLPASESLGQLALRVAPVWRDELAPRLAAGQNLLVAGHGLSLWAVCRLAVAAEGLDLPSLSLPNANPLILAFDRRGRLFSMSYLDQAAAGDLPPLSSLNPLNCPHDGQRAAALVQRRG